MQFHPVRFGPHIGGHNHIQRAGVQLVMQMMAGTGFQKELAPFQARRQIGQKARRHIGLEILDHPKSESGERRQIGHRQFCPCQ